MNNDPWRKRTPRSTLVKWLVEHPGVWWNYENAVGLQASLHLRRIFNAMQDAGLFAPRSQCNPLTIAGLVSAARAASEIVGTNNGTEIMKP